MAVDSPGGEDSAREDDLELQRQFGRPAFAYSGATATLLPYIQRTARIVDLYSGISSGYYRDNNRIAPYNLYARTQQLLRQATGASRAAASAVTHGHKAEPEGLAAAAVGSGRTGPTARRRECGQVPAAAAAGRWTATQ